MKETTTTPVSTTTPAINPASTVRSDVEIHGSVTFKGELAFGGQLTGGSLKGPKLTVSPGSNITGAIESEALTLHGTVTGNVVVKGKCEIKESAELFGDLTASRLVMGEGATFIGRAQINPGKGPVPAPNPTLL